MGRDGIRSVFSFHVQLLATERPIVFPSFISGGTAVGCCTYGLERVAHKFPMSERAERHASSRFLIASNDILSWITLKLFGVVIAVIGNTRGTADSDAGIFRFSGEEGALMR